MFNLTVEFWPHLVAVFNLGASLLASGHVVLHKQDSRAAIAWVGVIWLAPVVGVLLYLGLGVNRIERRAVVLRGKRPKYGPLSDPTYPVSQELLRARLGSRGVHLHSLGRLVGSVTQHSLLPGNRILPLVNGDQAYPVMLQAINEATRSVTLSTYIFDNDRAGNLFLDALRRAVARGVTVQVLIDDVGSRYSWPSMVRRLQQTDIPVARFLPTLVPWRFQYSNLRNHRKILVVDGITGFTGGMNIRAGSCLEHRTPHPIQDLHFRVEGPVVAHLQAIFAEDWGFATGEWLEGEAWFPALEAKGEVLARGIPDGPDEDLDTLRSTLIAALNCARSSVLVVTPYFLPDTALIMALNVAAMRGVTIDIVLPQHNNLILVQWASTALLWRLLERGCRVWLSPPPFDHSKLVIVDGIWTLLGSANWDPRSLRLNFEFDVECYDQVLADKLTRLLQAKLGRAKRVTLAEIHNRGLLVKLRDGVVQLLSPYL